MENAVSNRVEALTNHIETLEAQLVDQINLNLTRIKNVYKAHVSLYKRVQKNEESAKLPGVSEEVIRLRSRSP